MPGVASYKEHEIVFVFLKKTGPENLTNYEVAQLFKAEFPRRVTRVNKNNDFGPNQAKYILNNQCFKTVWNRWLAGDAQVLAAIAEFYDTNDPTCFPNGRLPSPHGHLAMQYSRDESNSMQFGMANNMGSSAGGYIGHEAGLGMASQDGSLSNLLAPVQAQISQNWSHGNGPHSHTLTALEFAQMDDASQSRSLIAALTSYEANEEGVGRADNQSASISELVDIIPSVPDVCQIHSTTIPHMENESASQNQLFGNKPGGTNGPYNPSAASMHEPPRQQEYTPTMDAQPQSSGINLSTPRTSALKQNFLRQTPNMGFLSQDVVPQFPSSQPIDQNFHNRDHNLQMQRSKSLVELGSASQSPGMSGARGASTSPIKEGYQANLAVPWSNEMANQESTMDHGNTQLPRVDSDHVSNDGTPVRQPTPAEAAQLHYLRTHGNEIQRKYALQVTTMLFWSVNGDIHRKRAASHFFLKNNVEGQMRKIQRSEDPSDQEKLRTLRMKHATILSMFQQTMRLILLQQKAGDSQSSQPSPGHIQNPSIDHTQSAISQIPKVAATPMVPHPNPQAALRFPKGPMGGVGKPLTPAQQQMLQQQVRTATPFNRIAGGQNSIVKGGRIQRMDVSNSSADKKGKTKEKEASTLSQPMEHRQQTPTIQNRVIKPFKISAALLDDTYCFPDETVFSGTLIDDRKWRIQGVLAEDAPALVCTYEGVEIHFLKPDIRGWLISYIKNERSKLHPIQNGAARIFSPQSLAHQPESEHSIYERPSPSTLAMSSMASTPRLGFGHLGQASHFQIQSHVQVQPQATTQGLGIDMFGLVPPTISSASTSNTTVGSTPGHNMAAKAPKSSATTPKPRGQKRMGEPMYESPENKKTKRGKESSGIGKTQAARSEAERLAQPHVQAEVACLHSAAHYVDRTNSPIVDMDHFVIASQSPSQQSTTSGDFSPETPQKQMIGGHDMSRQSSGSTVQTFNSSRSMQVFTPSRLDHLSDENTFSPTSSADSSTNSPTHVQSHESTARQQAEAQNALVAVEKAIEMTQAKEEAERNAKEEADAGANADEEEYDPIIAMEEMEINGDNIEDEMFFGQGEVDMDCFFGFDEYCE